jgi:hypothetical protein
MGGLIDLMFEVERQYQWTMSGKVNLVSVIDWKNQRKEVQLNAGSLAVIEGGLVLLFLSALQIYEWFPLLYAPSFSIPSFLV